MDAVVQFAFRYPTVKVEVQLGLLNAPWTKCRYVDWTLRGHICFHIGVHTNLQTGLTVGIFVPVSVFIRTPEALELYASNNIYNFKLIILNAAQQMCTCNLEASSIILEQQ